MSAEPVAESREREPLRIALVDSIPEWGGGQKWCVSAAEGLRSRGHSVLVACAAGSALRERAEAAGLAVWSRPVGRFGWGLGAGRELGRRIARDRIEAVIANVGRDLRMGAVACRRGGAKLLQRRGVLRPIRSTLVHRLVYARVERVIVNCEAIGARMRSGAAFVPPERFFVLPNGVPRRAPPTADERAAARRALELPAQARVVASIARLSPMKGHAVLLAAWAEVARAHPDALLLIVGDGELRGELEAETRRLRLDASVRFLGFRSDVSAILDAIDLLCLASVRDEGCNNTLLEAMAHARPAVVTDCGGLPELVVDGETGHVVPSGDPAPLAAAIRELLQDDATRERMGAAAAERVAREFGLERVTERLERFLLELRTTPLVGPDRRRGPSSS